MILASSLDRHAATDDDSVMGCEAAPICWTGNGAASDRRAHGVGDDRLKQVIQALILFAFNEFIEL
jgi:hypothetical protein